MILPLLLAMASATGHARSLPQPLTARRIEVQSDWYGLNFDTPHLQYHFVLVAHNGQFPREYQKRVARLLSALELPPQNQLTAADIFPRPDSVDTDVDVSDAIRDWEAFPAVLTAYIRLYRDAHNQQGWIDELFGSAGRLPTMFHTDDAPNISATVWLTNGTTVQIASHRQVPYMLPFEIIQAGKRTITYSPALPKALALLIAGNLNAERLSGYSAFDEYAGWLSARYGPQLADAKLRAFSPEAWALWHREGWISDTRWPPTLEEEGMSGYEGEARLPSWDDVNFSFHVRSAPYDREAMQRALLHILPITASSATRVDTLPWLRTWLSKNDRRSLSLRWFLDSYVEHQRILDNLKIHAPTLYHRVASSEHLVLCGDLESEDHVSSTWLFLPDGDSVLVAFDDGDPLGPLRAGQFRAWTGEYPFEHTAAAVVAPNGALRSVDASPATR